MQVTPELIEMITKQVMGCLNAEGKGRDACAKLFVAGEKNTADCLMGQFVIETAKDRQGCVNAAEYEAFVITSMDTQLLADLALGTCRLEDSRILSDALLLGKNVYAAEEGITFMKYRHTANARYYQLFVEYLKKLESYGIAVMPFEKISRSLSVKENDREESIKKQEPAEKKEVSLFSADMARSFARKGETTLKVFKGTLITPLAKDILREKKIKIVYET